MENVNLKEILAVFHITNAELSEATGLSMSSVRRYLSGTRRLKRTGKPAERIAEHLLVKADTGERIGWLKGRLREAGLPDGEMSVVGIKHNLIQWISSDDTPIDTAWNRDVKKNTGEDQDVKGIENGTGMCNGVLSITACAEKMLEAMPKDGNIDVFLTSDRIRIMTEEHFSSFLKKAALSLSHSISLVIGVSGNTQGINRFIQCYMDELVSGRMRFYTFFGAPQNVTEQLYMIFRTKGVVMVTESSIGLAEPIGTVIRTPVFLAELCRSFDATYRYSQPMFNIYDDANTRGMIEAVYGEYCVPGELSVATDCICPMFLPYEDYCGILRSCNTDDAEYAWKCNEYRRFYEDFNKMLHRGMKVREILSLDRLRSILNEGKCRMPGLYFLTIGTFELDLGGCRKILQGYIDHLNRYESFSMLILDDIPELHGSSCWHVKRGASIAVSDWSGGAVMCESHHSTLVHEFQHHFDEIWERGTGSIRNKAFVISILREIIEEIDAQKG